MKRYLGGLTRYLAEGIQPGDFLTSVLANDLTYAVMTADEQSLKDLPEIVKALYWYAPGAAWGNRERVREWKGPKEGVYLLSWRDYLETQGLTAEEALKL